MELVLGEVLSVLETIQHGLLDREKSCAQSYDRIHLSNIPDYIVGPLASILFAVSLLKPVSEAVVTANCLRNTPIWDNVHQSPCEYLAVGDRDTINKLMQVSFADLQSVENNSLIEQLQRLLRSLSSEQLRWMDLSFLRDHGLEHIRDLDPETIRCRDIRSLSTVNLDDDGVVGNRLAK